VAQDLVKTRFPALWVEGEGVITRPNVAKRFRNSGDCNFSGWMLKSPRMTSGVSSSGKQLRRASTSSNSLRGAGGR